MSADGNGHLTRGLLTVPYLSALGADVDCILSGRPSGKFDSMLEFGDYKVHTGISFAKNEGGVDWVGSILRSSPLDFIKSVYETNTRDYDAVITDFEPITAHAANIRGQGAIGLGHQYAFRRDVPGNCAALKMMPLVSPTRASLGTHWHHFGQKGITPPFVHQKDDKPKDESKIVVYMPVESTQKLIALFRPFSQYNFKIYSPQVDETFDEVHITFAPTSRDAFMADFETAGGYISNAGFESPSEALAMGVPMLLKPMKGQPEQMANAKAITALKWGGAMDTLDPKIVADWLNNKKAVKIRYPNVGAAIAEWVVNGDHSQKSADLLAKQLWEQTDYGDFTSRI